MASDYLTAESDEVRNAMALLDSIERAMRKGAENYTPSIGKECYLNGDEVCKYLHISPRTLQTLRDRHEIPFTVLSGRIFLYPESGLLEMLQQNYE